MSVGITIHCNQQWQHGSCATSLITGARTLDDADRMAARRGWRIHPDGRHYCPGHSGTTNPAATGTVVRLYPGNHQDETPSPPVSGPLETVTAAARILRSGAADTDTEMAANTYWHSELVPSDDWFMQGIDNAVGGPAGRLAGLLNPTAARHLAALLDRHTGTGTPIPAEVFLLARTIHRSSR
ncbi:hypothetical protein ACFUEN_29155 [Streptomyces griseorubiginosus]|uniref:hypothetical protein n=1 Tax=Streptomyces griseorubiginosus TaxID=67304 RepID=UPI0036366E34